MYIIYSKEQSAIFDIHTKPIQLKKIEYSLFFFLSSYVSTLTFRAEKKNARTSNLFSASNIAKFEIRKSNLGLIFAPSPHPQPPVRPFTTEELNIQNWLIYISFLFRGCREHFFSCISIPDEKLKRIWLLLIIQIIFFPSYIWFLPPAWTLLSLWDWRIAFVYIFHSKIHTTKLTS